MVKPRVIDLKAYKNQRMTSLPTPAAWADPLQRFTQWMRASDYPTSTQDKRHYHLRRFANTSRLAPFEATTEQLIDYLGAHAWSAQTKRSHRATLRAFYTWAYAAGHIRTDPASLLPIVRTTPGRPRPIPEHVLRQAMATAGERERLMIRLGAEASMRSCEICLVNVADIIGIPDAYSIVIHGKGNKIRVVPIDDGLAVNLTQRGRKNIGGWVFEGKIDGHLSNKRVIELLSDALPGEWAGHSLRHRYGTITYQGSKDIRSVQENMGHASVATTQIYTGIDDDQRRRASAFAKIA